MGTQADDVGALVAAEAIRRVVLRYCRAVDRRDLDAVRACYHPDATDDHGTFRGGLDGLLPFLARELARWSVTQHLVANQLVDLDPADPDRARCESYVVAFHREEVAGGVRDHVAGIRYVDDVERRGGEWRIAARAVVVDWTRADPAPVAARPLGDAFLRGAAAPADPVFAPSLRALLDRAP